MTELFIRTNDDEHYISAREEGGPEGEMIAEGNPELDPDGDGQRPVGLADAHGTAVGGDEELRIIYGPNNSFSLVSKKGFVLSAQPDGSLVFNRVRDLNSYVPDAWELFTPVDGFDGGEGIKTVHGTLVYASNQGGGWLGHHQRDVVGIDENFWPSVPFKQRHGSPVGNGFDGQVKVDPRGGFMRNEQPVFIVSCHHGDGFGHAQRNWAAEMNRLDVIFNAGYDASREWPTLGGNFWAGLPYDERGEHQQHWPGDGVDRRCGPVYTSNFRTKLLEYYQEKKKRSLYSHIANGALDSPTVPDWRELAHIFRDTIAAVGYEYFVVGEVINEARDTMGDRAEDIELAREFGRIAYGSFPGMCIGISAYTGADYEATQVNPERLTHWSQSPANVIMHHGYRGGGYPNKLERDWNLSYDWELDPSKPIYDGEPVGTQERTSATENMHELNGAFFTLRAAIILGTGRVCTHMSGAGVITDEGKGRLEDSAGFYEIPRVKKLLPPNCGHYRKVFHGGDRWSNERLFAATEHTRCEHMINEETGEFLVVCYGPDSFTRQPVRSLKIDADHRVEQDNIRGRIIWGRA